MATRYPETGDLIGYAEEHILEMGLQELRQLMNIADINGDSSLKDTQDIRDRLVCIRRTQLGCHHNWTPLFTAIQSETNARVNALADILQHMRNIMSHIPTVSADPLSEVLRQEDYLEEENIMAEIRSRREKLLREDNTLIVAGETNGGKSSLLNLLLGQDILPTAFTHCTFTICKIKYSPNYRVETLLKDGISSTRDCRNLAEARDALVALVTQDDARARESRSPIIEVTIHMPSTILKSGVILVDTPGIGESPEMDEVTLNYVRSTHASGFIYVIKTDTAGGVQEDRLMPFLTAIREQYQTGTLREAFDHKAAMFVCNRWDQIKPDQRDQVKANARKNLDSVWPGFDESQTFFFSTTGTKRHLSVDPHYVTDSYFELLHGLKDLFNTALANAIRQQYIWLKHIIQAASRHLRSMITHCINSDEELENYFRKVAAKQEQLMSDSGTNSLLLRRELDTRVLQLNKAILDMFILDKSEIKAYLPDYQELLKECSEEGFLISKENRLALDEKLVDNLLRYVDKRVKQEELMEDLEGAVLRAIEGHLGLFRTQVLQIKWDLCGSGESYLNSSCNSLESLTNTGSLRYEDFEPPEVRTEESDSSSLRRHFSHLRLNGQHTMGSSTSSYPTEDIEDNFGAYSTDPVQLASYVKALLRRKRKHFRKSSTGLQTRREIRQSAISRLIDKVIHGGTYPKEYLWDRCCKIGQDIRKDNLIVGKIVAGYAEWIQECVKQATNSVPKFTAVNALLMQQISSNRQMLHSDKGALKKAMHDLEPCRNQLKGYGSLYMADVRADMLNFNLEQRDSSIEVPTDLSVSVTPKRDSGFVENGIHRNKVRCLWANLRAATILIDEKPQPVVLKSYTYDIGESVLLGEIASLRCIEHKNVAAFYGMTRLKMENESCEQTDATPVKISGFIFKGNITSASIYRNRRLTCLREWVPTMLHSLLNALNFIHKEKLVHMELNAHTVTVEKDSGQVKLCHIGVPRRARMPECQNMLTKSSVCLSPEVLRGDTYESKDDLYAFGLLLWEMLFPLKPYADERTWNLEDFVKNCDPVSMLKISMNNLNASDDVKRVLEGTIFGNREGIGRLTVLEIQSILSNLKDDPASKALKSNRPGPIQPRRQSVDESTSECNVSKRFPIQTVPEHPDTNQSTAPTRPPRRKKICNKQSGHQSVSAEQGSTPGQPSQNRRVSCPSLSTTIAQFNSKTLPKIKKNNNFLSSLKNLFKASKIDDGKDRQMCQDNKVNKGRRMSLAPELPKNERHNQRRFSELSPPSLQLWKFMERSDIDSCNSPLHNNFLENCHLESQGSQSSYESEISLSKSQKSRSNRLSPSGSLQYSPGSSRINRSPRSKENENSHNDHIELLATEIFQIEHMNMRTSPTSYRRQGQGNSHVPADKTFPSLKTTRAPTSPPTFQIGPSRNSNDRKSMATSRCSERDFNINVSIPSQSPGVPPLNSRSNGRLTPFNQSNTPIDDCIDYRRTYKELDLNDIKSESRSTKTTMPTDDRRNTTQFVHSAALEALLSEGSKSKHVIDMTFRSSAGVHGSYGGDIISSDNSDERMGHSLSSTGPSTASVSLPTDNGGDDLVHFGVTLSITDNSTASHLPPSPPPLNLDDLTDDDDYEEHDE